MQVVIFTETRREYEQLCQQLGIIDEYARVPWVNPTTAMHKLMGIARGTLLMLTLTGTSFDPEVRALLHTRGVIVVAVECERCTRGNRLLAQWEAEDQQALKDNK